MKYLKNDSIFYQNNPAKFVCYLSEKTAVIIISLLPNFDDTTTVGSCTGCMIGDSDNKLSCTCDETEYVLELLEENTYETEIPLIVNSALIYDKPIIVMNHESKIKELVDTERSIRTKINKFKLNISEMENKKTDLELTLKDLTGKVDDFNYLKDFNFTIEQFSRQLASNRADGLFSECDSRSVFAGFEELEFRFQGNDYRLELHSYWPENKERYLEYTVTGISIDYSKVVGFAQ